MGVLHGNRDRVEPPGPNLVKSRDPLADPILPFYWPYYFMYRTHIHNSHGPARKQYYSTGVQIVSCTLSDDSVLSESTGLFNPVLCVSQWNLFWQKNQPMRLCLSNQVRPGRECFPSPLGDFNRLFEGLIGELFKIWHWNMFYFFKMTSVWPLKCKFVSLLCW